MTMTSSAAAHTAARVAPLFALTLTLAACGGGGGDSDAPTVAQFTATLAQDSALTSRIAGDTSDATQNGLAIAAAPTTGGATYRGLGAIGVGTPGSEDVLMRGDATVNANFVGNTLDGSITNIVAIDSRNASPTPVLVNETIALSNGQIDTSNRQNFTLDYSGSPTVGSTSFQLSGTMNGNFRGTGASAVSATADAQPITVDGTATTYGIGVVAEE